VLQIRSTTVILGFFLNLKIQLVSCTAALLPELQPAPGFLSAIIG